MPRNQVLRENYDAMTASPNPKSKQNTPNAAHRRFPSKENAPPPPAIDPNSPAVKTKSPLPPRPPLKRKLSVESGASDNCSVMANSVDSGVKVVVRVRPPNGEEEDGGNALQKITEDSLTISGQTFTFDSIVDIQSKQIDIFELVGAPLVENCLSGFNGSVFAYGQTGSGKTYTIWGASNALLDEDHQGLAPRVFRKLFERIEEEQVKQADKQLMYMCRCSFLEIYNEQITDLLDPSQKNLQIREDVKTGVYVENLTEECVSSMKDVAQLLVKGLSNRRTSATYANAESSRSHSVFTCVVESRSKRSADGLSYMKTSRINFVDLAGSERQKQTGAAGERLKEAGNINRSLSQLGNLINILAEVSQTGKQRHIPYRDSKLTFLLQESLGGNAKLAMICAISPSRSCQSETISTLRFAQRAKSIKNRAIINEEMQDDVNVLREVIRQLRDELQRVKTNNSQANQTGAYAIGWNARRSLNLLRYSLNRPTALPHGKDDSDEEMEIVDSNEAMPSIHEGTRACSPERVCDDADVNMEDGTFETVVMGHSSHDVSATQMASLERKSDIEPDNVSCGQSEKGETRKPIEQCSSMDLPANADTPEKNTNCSDDAMTANARVAQIDVSPVLTSPAPSVSPKLSSSRKSLRTSSTITASQCFPSQHTSEAADVPIMKPSKSICLTSISNRRSCFASTEHLAATLHRGLEIIASQRLNPAMRRSSFRFSSMPAEVKTVIPVVKVDVGVQAVSQDDLMNQDAGDSLCIKCKNEKHMQELTNIDGEGDAQNLQLVPVSGSPLHEKCKSQVPRAVEKVLAGAIRREMALEEICSKQNSEIMQLNRLVQQYKHERECNEIIRQTREDKIARLESLMDGILPTEDFMEEELLSLTHEHKILIKKYDNHPDVTRAKLELKKAQDELEKYQNFFDLGEKDILLEEVQDLRNQLQLYLDSSAKTFRRQAPLVQLTSSVEPSVAPTLFTDPREIAEERLQQERIQWTEAESKWISLVEELKTELEENRSIAQRQKQELDMEKNCSDELKEAMHMAMEGHARMLEQYAELEERHMQLLARHRKIQDGIDDVKRAAAKAGVRGAESKFINALAAEISALKVEREKERRHFRDENKGLQAQLRDTAEAVQAANELLVRLKETEEALAAEQRRATMAEQETENAYKEMEKLSKLLTARHMPVDKFSGEECKGAASNQQWQEEFAPSYGAEEEPPAWFSGYDRCNI